MAGRWYALILLFALVLCRAAEGQSPFAPQAGVLVLRNGQVLDGEVTRAGDYFVVSRGEGSELKLKTDDVELFCASMLEAYEFKVNRLSGLSAKPHLELAQWCLRHGMHSQCTEQIEAARRQEPNNQQVKELETRLKLATEAPPPPSPARTAPAVAAEDLEQTLSSLPKGSVEKFGAIVQPILLNRCAANQCHGPNSKSAFRLLRPPPGQIVSRRFTQRNLHAAMQYVDRVHPEASPLVVLPQQRHGNSLSAVFDKHSSNQLGELLAWAKISSGFAAAVNTAPGPAPATIAPGETTLSQPAVNGAAADGVGVRVMRPATEGAAAPDQTTPASAAKESGPRDRFDPDIFNRRFHGK